MLVILSSKNVKQGHKRELTYLYACWIIYMKHHLQIWKNESQRWPEMPLILARSGTQNVAMVTKLLSSYCEAHLTESYCQESNISNINWLRHLFSSYLIKIWLSVWRLTWRICIFWNLNISRTKRDIENSKRYLSSHTDCLFMFKNGLDRKDGIDRKDFRHSTTLKISSIPLNKRTERQPDVCRLFSSVSNKQR